MSGMGKPGTGTQQTWQYSSSTDAWSGGAGGGGSAVGVMRAGSGNPNTLPSFVQGISSGGLTATTPGAVTAGNLLVVQVQTEGSVTSTTVSDNLGTSYALAVTLTGAGVNTRVYYGLAPSSGVVTVTGNQPNTFARTSIGEYKNATNVIDTSGTSYAGTSISITTATANCLVLGLVGSFHSSETYTAGANMTADFNGTGSDATFYEHAAVVAAGAFTVGYSASSTDGATFIAIAFKQTPGLVLPGNDGDFYIDTTNRVLYGPRGSGSYPRIGSLSA